jgi:hypothetical protein
VEAPDGTAGAWRVSGAFEEPSRRILLVLRQAAGAANPDTGYTASAYVRSPSGGPTEVWLSTNQGDRYPCGVGPGWTRCTAGPDRGAGGSTLQFRLWSRADVEPFVLDVWGPQLESGVSATAVELTGVTVMGRLAHRLASNAGRILFRRRVGDRFAVMRSGWGVFLGRPWLGAGRSALSAVLAGSASAPPRGGSAAGAGRTTTANSTEPDDGSADEAAVDDRQQEEAALAHAHDLVVQLLAEIGVLGAVGALAVFLGPVALLPRRRLLRFAPALMAFAMWNAIDFTAFFAPAFLTYMAALGYVTWSEEP